MKKIKSFKCHYCGKIYQKENSCKNHERRCYYNPATRSCVSCAFFRKEEILCLPGNIFRFNACLLNHNLVNKLKTNCLDYESKETFPKLEAMKLEKGYKPLRYGIYQIMQIIKMDMTGFSFPIPPDDLEINYVCPWCGKNFKDPDLMTSHSFGCEKNPIAHSCDSCAYNTKALFTLTKNRSDVCSFCIINNRAIIDGKSVCDKYLSLYNADNNEFISMVFSKAKGIIPEDLFAGLNLKSAS